MRIARIFVIISRKNKVGEKNILKWKKIEKIIEKNCAKKGKSTNYPQSESLKILCAQNAKTVTDNESTFFG